ncbi:uncharacterized protein LOC130998119 [Salvia miltiorrhiza]|uniref:uncharacterized protein LOC130998119 n=1 Tax=Salvia miltiorrhiza TaxID=226208 RepID=UPI0025AC9D72|nr:uncharacterized protein LOC130998119 [Salvia miltiorrhiza]
MNILVWNVRGLTDESKDLLKEHCRSFSPLILGLIEPKKKFHKVRQSFWRSLNLVPRHQNCRQPRCSNIWLLAHPSVSSQIIHSSAQTVIANCTWHSKSFRIAVVHGANDSLARRSLWIELLTFVDGNTVFIGDFNAVKGAHERRSSVSPSRSSCRDFCDFIEATEFIESPTSVLLIFGRVLILMFFRVSPLIILPLVLQCKAGLDNGRRAFKFLNMWVSHPNFQDMVDSSWTGLVDTNCPIYKIMHKLKRLRGDLRVWNKTVFGHVDIQIQEGQQKLMEVQNKISNLGYTDEYFDEEVDAQASLSTLLARKNSLLQQKSRATWLTDGNSISYDTEAIQQHIIDFFSNLFTGDGRANVDRVMLEAIIDPYVSDEQNDILTGIPTDEEITASVFGMDANSSPGPDGFSGLFYQNCWNTIKADIFGAVRAFFLNSYLPAGCNASTLILIPKKDIVDSVADLRPIILSNFFFKIISKILATRLSVVAAAGVSPNQFGFISGRSIHDCIMLGSEGFCCMNRTGRRSNMACKIDIHKAFDTMSWDFIFQVLRVNGYHERFIRWISIIFTSARISILYNGQLSGYFACSRGVRQGDPLSPILFGIAEDVLSHLFLNCVRSQHLVPMDFSRGSVFPTHLFYADDILIFCKATRKNARKIKEILDFYGELSGQLCNSAKSHVFFGSGVSTSIKSGVTRDLGFALGSMPVTYLGVPLFNGRIKASLFMAIYDKIVNKFSNWKGLHLSMAGRICLVRSVIQSSVTHSMMVYRWPKSLIYSLDRKCRNFIWTGNVNKKPSCPVSWSRACASRVEGGLGIRSFSNMNKSFLMKMAWKLVQGTEFAHSILSTRYLTRFGYAKDYLASSPIWTGVREHVNNLIDQSYSYVGTGEHTYFWRDDWLWYKLWDKLHIPPFMMDFLTQAVSDYFFDGIWHFTADFVINFPDIVVDILLLPIGEEDDTRFWKHSVTGKVTAASAYAAQNHRFPEVRWGRWIWEKFIPERRSLICWRIIHKKMPTIDGLVRRGMAGPNRCIICCQDEESIDHLFWRCRALKTVWTDFLAWFGKEEYLSFDDIHSVLVTAWHEKFSTQVVSFWKAGIMNLLWQIWDCRNQATFNDVDVLGSLHALRRPPTMIEVHWWPPAGHWIKVNTDGSALGAPGNIAVGGVFRDNFGWVRGCFHFKGGVGFAFEAELLAAIYAINIADNRGWRSLWIEADSTYIVNLLNSRSNDVPWRFMALWKRTISLLSNFNFQVSHIYREGNTAAKIMANQNRSEGWWPFAIEDIKNAVALDLATHSRVRIKF